MKEGPSSETPGNSATAMRLTEWSESYFYTPLGPRSAAQEPQACLLLFHPWQRELWGFPWLQQDPVRLHRILSGDLAITWALFPRPPVQEIWRSDAPSGINTTNGQNQIPAFLRRQEEPQRSTEEAENVQWVLFDAKEFIGEQALPMA